MKIFSKNTWGVDVNNAWPLTCKASCLKKNRVTSLDFGIWLCIVGGTESVRGFPTEATRKIAIRIYEMCDPLISQLITILTFVIHHNLNPSQSWTFQSTLISSNYNQDICGLTVSEIIIYLMMWSRWNTFWYGKS